MRLSCLSNGEIGQIDEKNEELEESKGQYMMGPKNRLKFNKENLKNGQQINEEKGEVDSSEENHAIINNSSKLSHSQSDMILNRAKGRRSSDNLDIIGHKHAKASHRLKSRKSKKKSDML